MKPEVKPLISCVILTGNVGTCKSTYVKTLQKETDREYVVIDVDSISTMVGGTGEYNFDMEKLDLYISMKKALLRTALDKRYNVILDGTHIAKQNRKAYIKIMKQYNTIITVVDFGRGTEESLTRRCVDNRGQTPELWRSVHNRFYESYEQPSLDEGIDVINSTVETN